MSRVPGEWLPTTLGDVVLPQKERQVPSPDHSLPFIGMEHVESNTGHIEDLGTSDQIRSSSPIVVRGDVLYGRLRPYLNKVTIAPVPAFTSGEFIVFRGNDQIDARFLRWRLTAQDFVAFACSLNTGDRPRVKWPQMANFPLVLPRLDEQRRIVDILEDHLSRLDAGNRSLTLALQRASTLRASVIDRAAQGSLDGEQTGQNGLCQGWEWVPPAEVSDERKGIVIGPFGSNLKTSDYRDEGVPLVFVRNVRRGYFGPHGQRYVSVAKAAELSSHEVLHGDVVITKMGDPPGEAAVYDATEPGVITADVIRLRPRPGQSSDYLAMAINSSKVARQIQQITRGVAQKKVSLARFRSEIRIPVPDHETQIRVARQVADLTEGVARIVRQSETAKIYALSLRRSLLMAAFSGRLTGRASDMEMVEEMASV